MAEMAASIGDLTEMQQYLEDFLKENYMRMWDGGEYELVVKKCAARARRDIPDEIPKLSDDAAKPNPAHFSPSEVTSELILSVLHAIQDDTSLPTKFRGTANDCIVDSLVVAMEFLSMCVSKKRKFQSAAKEASWGNFHTAVLRNLPRLQPITGSTQFSSWLCLKTFTSLLSHAFQVGDSASAATVQHNPRDDDIVIYVGGSVVCKMRKAAYRLTDEEKAVQLDVLSCLVSSKGESFDSSSSLTSILDRGGLVRLMPQSQAMFIEMESTFLRLFSDAHLTNLSSEQYSRECLLNDSILSGFYESTYDSMADDNVKLYILRGILALYFRIRAHHKCRSFMDSYRQKKKVTKKQQSLRQGLKGKK